MSYNPLTMKITSITEFSAAKRGLVEKWGDKLLLGTNDDVRNILRDCEPLAKYAKVPAERLHTALARDYVERGGSISRIPATA